MKQIDIIVDTSKFRKYATNELQTIEVADDATNDEIARAVKEVILDDMIEWHWEEAK